MVAQQKRALNKYFDDVPGLEPDKVKPEQLSVATPDGNDLQEIEPIANEIKESDICFVKIDRLSDFPNRASNLEGAFFTFNTSDVKDTRYGFIQSVDNEFVYISYTKNWYWFQKYLDGQNGKPCKIKQKDAPINKSTDLSIGVFGTKISTGQFFNVLKPGIVKLNGLSAVKDAKPENKYQKVNLDVKNVVWLSTETEKDKSYELKKLSDFAKLRGTIDTIRNSGFTKIKETIKDGGTKDNPLLTGK